MTAVHKKFEEKKQEELARVEERFDALLKNGGAEGVNSKQEEKAPEQEDKGEEGGEG